MTWLIIAITVAVWFLLQGAGSPSSVAASVCDLGMVPGEHRPRAGGARIANGAGAVLRRGWFFVQVVAGLPQLSSVRPDVSSGVAVWADVGSSLAGIALIRPFENPALVARRGEMAVLREERLRANPWGDSPNGVGAAAVCRTSRGWISS